LFYKILLGMLVKIYFYLLLDSKSKQLNLVFRLFNINKLTSKYLQQNDEHGVNQKSTLFRDTIS